MALNFTMHNLDDIICVENLEPSDRETLLSIVEVKSENSAYAIHTNARILLNVVLRYKPKEVILDGDLRVMGLLALLLRHYSIDPLFLYGEYKDIGNGKKYIPLGTVTIQTYQTWIGNSHIFHKDFRQHANFNKDPMPLSKGPYKYDKT
jgi:hypothetical protein